MTAPAMVQPAQSPLAGRLGRCAIPLCYERRLRHTPSDWPACCRVIVAHSSAPVRSLLSFILRTEAFAPVEAERAEDVLRLAAHDPPHLLVVNHVLHGYPAASLIQSLRKSPVAQVRAMGVVGLCPDEEPRRQLAAAGASRCLPKPFTDRAVVEAVRLALTTYPSLEGDVECAAT